MGGRHGLVGGALSQEERLAEHALHLLGRRALRLEGADLLLELAVALVHPLECDGRPLEEFLDLFGSVAPERLPQLGVAEIVRRDIHASILTITHPVRVDPATAGGQ